METAMAVSLAVVVLGGTVFLLLLTVVLAMIVTDKIINLFKVYEAVVSYIWNRKLFEKWKEEKKKEPSK